MGCLKLVQPDMTRLEDGPMTGIRCAWPIEEEDEEDAVLGRLDDK